MSELSPIVVFTYNRPDHTKRTLDALRKNKLASKSNLYIYSDAAKAESEVYKVNEVRKYISSVKGFNKIEIIKREENWGLANSIINGVTNILDEYDKIIVLEDDIITSPYFLNFMNDALDYYEHSNKIWHVSGWNYPINNNGLGDAYFVRIMNCWGWGTWKNKWKAFNKDTESIIAKFNLKMIKEFDLDNSGVFWSQIKNNKKGKINTWAIYWYAAIFMNGGLCLNPSHTFVYNIGHDGSGVHCGNVEKQIPIYLNKKTDYLFPNDKIESQLAVERIKEYYRNKKKPFWIRVFLKVSQKIFNRKK